MPGIFDPGVMPDDSPTSDDGTPRGAEGQRPDDGEAGGDLDNQLAELRRKNAELEQHLTASLAREAALKAQPSQEHGQPAGSDKPRYTVDQLKEFADREDGKYQFDSAVAYTNQRLEEEFTSFEERFRAKMKKEQADVAVQQAVSSILPEISDPNSPFTQRVKAESQSLMAQYPGLDPQRAHELAILAVARKTTPGRPPTSESAAAHSARRRAEMSGVIPTGSGIDEGQPSRELTPEQLELGRKRYRIKSIDDPNPQRRAAARAFLKQLFDRRDDNVMYRRSGGVVR